VLHTGVIKCKLSTWGPTMTKNYEAIQEYEAQIAASRKDFEQHPAVRTVCYDEIDAQTLEAFLIYFSALGVGMTEPVGRWIRRAGERCAAIGLPILARALAAHAQHEEGHQRLMESDTHHLVRLWNGQHQPKLDAVELLALDHTAGVAAYRALHEDIITGSTPYGQLAIEYEIEMLSVDYAPLLIARCIRSIGKDVLQGLSFLEEHVELDVGHTKFNRLQMSKLLEEQPGFLDGLVSGGSGALKAYAMFLDDCVTLARLITRN
jgi:hypothetical protein